MPSPFQVIYNTVRAIAAEEGWHPAVRLNVYNDKRADGTRRLAFCYNGWRVPARMKATILQRVQDALMPTYSSLHDVHKVYWHVSDSFRGEYDKLCIKLTPAKA